MPDVSAIWVRHSFHAQLDRKKTTLCLASLPYPRCEARSVYYWPSNVEQDLACRPTFLLNDRMLALMFGHLEIVINSKFCH